MTMKTNSPKIDKRRAASALGCALAQLEDQAAIIKAGGTPDQNRLLNVGKFIDEAAAALGHSGQNKHVAQVAARNYLRSWAEVSDSIAALLAQHAKPTPVKVAEKPITAAELLRERERIFALFEAAGIGTPKPVAKAAPAAKAAPVAPRPSLGEQIEKRRAVQERERATRNTKPSGR